MVGYNSDDNALTLGNDDSIAVGDYSIRYSSGNDRFEVEHPNGEISNIPRSTSGSLVPQGLAESVSAGEALADDGNTYETVQAAVDAASGWVFVGPGTFNEAVTISTEGLTLEGCGEGTLIDGGATGEAISISGENVSLRNIQLRNTLESSGSDTLKAENTASNCIIESVVIEDSDNTGIAIKSSGGIVTNCKVKSASSRGITYTSTGGIISSCFVSSTGAEGVTTFDDDTIVSNCVIVDSGNDGLRTGANNDLIYVGNRIINSTDSGINIQGIDNIVANNRVSDSTNQDINDNGTGTVLDDNLTGASN